MKGRLGLLLVILASIIGCKEENAYKPPPAPTVTVSPPLRESVNAYLDLTGNTAASKTVDLVARVEGYLQSVDFKDGSFVKAGQLLFVIEPLPFETNLKLQEAALAQAQAKLTNAQSEYERQQRMQQQNATSDATVEKWRAQRDEGIALVQQAKANAEIARINLGYTRVTAPFDGRIGRHLVDPGNIVGAGTPTKLATLEQLEPIFAYFTLNERDVLRIMEARRDRGAEPGPNPAVPVFAGLQTETDFPNEGRMDFVATGLDTATGTIQVRAVFPNKNHVLLPGLFVRLRIPLGAPSPHLLVPERIMGTDQVGPYVLVVGDDGVVQQRRVKLGSTVNGMRVVLDGLAETDLVVIDGTQYATPGSKVVAKRGELTSAGPKSGP